MTDKALQNIIEGMTAEKFKEYSARFEYLLNKDPEKGTEEYEELLELYLIIETWEEIRFRLDFVHVRDVQKLMWSYTAIITAIFSVLFAIFMRK